MLSQNFPDLQQLNDDDDEMTQSTVSLSGTSCDQSLAKLADETSVETEPTKNTDDDDDGSLCPICLDNWTNSGDRRICALKCGHVFCYKCVYRWLDTQQQKSCPTCKKPASKSEIRLIYAKKLIAIDNSELEIMKERLYVTTEEKNRLQVDLANYVTREGILKQEISSLRTQIVELSKNRVQGCSDSMYNKKYDPEKRPIKLYTEKSLEICRHSGCRVFDTNTQIDLIIASSKSPIDLFSGFGIKKVDMSTYKPLAFIPLHSQQIRDVRFHPVNRSVLTASMDKSFRIVDIHSNIVISSSTLNMPLWSTCWDTKDPNMFYIGTQTGSVLKYDIRNIQEPVCTLSVPGDMSPVVSIASIPPTSEERFPCGALILCKLNSLWLFEDCRNDYKRDALPLSGPFISMKYNSSLKQLLVSSRPNNVVSHTRHSVFTLNKTSEGEVVCNTTHTFVGGRMQMLLSKSCFISNQQDYVAAYEESLKCVVLWSINTGERVAVVPTNDAVLDLNGICYNNENYLVSLTQRKMDFLKFV
ncbi:unnamed protein product [Diabrotica balteata]|uniref:RING-type E3 ubiquitin transferase n=1 Tax=Diabrotica balteata TaxID=107213 RepID=A0A9N9T9F1_DIABA|nr:unnamed protein product [Diabrotica balteata]